jgi:hypothetical protein
MDYPAWVFGLIAFILFGLPIPFCVFVLAISPAKGQTIKRMFLVFISVAPAIVVVGVFAARLLASHAVARLTGMLCVPVALLAAAFAGLHHARRLRSRGFDFSSVTTRK